MKQFATALFFALALAGPSMAAHDIYPDHPASSGLVVGNDFANIIPPADEQALERKFRAFEAETKAEVVVATVPSLQGEDVDTYSHDLFQKWGIGKKGSDNGVLFLIAPHERTMRLSPGKRLEPILTDAASKMILHNQVAPHFKKGEWVAGINAGTDGIIDTLRPALKGDEGKMINSHAVSKTKKHGGFGWIIVVFGLGLVVLLWRGLLRNRDELELREYPEPYIPPEDRFERTPAAYYGAYHRATEEKERSEPEEDSGPEISFGGGSDSSEEESGGFDLGGGGDSGGGAKEEF